MSVDFARCQRPHFVGIGGAGQSALARLLLRRGLAVSGCDQHPTPVTEKLRDIGARIWHGHDPIHLDEADWVIRTDAVPCEHPEIKEAEARGLPVWRRSQLLGYLMSEKKGIAVTGTHGKTTTTALLGTIFVEAGLDPTILIGAEVPELDGNLRLGVGDWFIAEACEAYAGVADLRPKVALVLNLESDHLHHHRTFENLVATMKGFVQNVPEDGLLVTSADDAVCASIAKEARCRVVTFGVRNGEYRATCISFEGKESFFHLEPLSERFEVGMVGEHNIRNALAAAVTAYLCGCSKKHIAKGLRNPMHPERRLQEKETVAGIVFVDDYAHHPTEIRASLSALRTMYPGRRLVVAFQPHLYTRTRDYLPEFAEALTEVDALVLTDIYPAREAPIPGVGSARLAEEVARRKPSLPFLYVPSLLDVPDAVLPNLREKDVFVAMGAGDIAEILPPIMERLAEKRDPNQCKVLVLAGGTSAEREISRSTGQMVARALSEKGLQVTTYDPAPLREFLTRLISGAPMPPSAGEQIPDKPDVVFVALHGFGGEDGCIQGLLDVVGIPYTGSGVLASALAMNKDRTKAALAAAGLPVVEGVLLSRAEPSAPLPSHLLPAVVKPNAQGSSVGLGFAQTEDQLKDAIRIGFRYDREVIVERWLVGTELSACVLGNDRPQVLPLVEIVPARGAYDYESKYTPGLTEEIVPARVPESVAAEAARIAAECHRTLGCAGFSRVDMMLSDGTLYVLEVNTVPGMTPTSIFPRAAAAAGISFPDLCERLVMLALEAADARRPVL